MPNTPESPQIKILHAIFIHGGVNVPTKEIMKESGLDKNNTHNSGKHLVSRFIVTKKTIKQGRLTYSYWSVRPQALEKAKRMLKEAYGTEF